MADLSSCKTGLEAEQMQKSHSLMALKLRFKRIESVIFYRKIPICQELEIDTVQQSLPKEIKIFMDSFCRGIMFKND